MPKQKGIKSGEAKPLLANSSRHADAADADEESDPVGYLGPAGALAPPPSSAPPPPPQDKPSDSDNTSSYQKPDDSTSLLLPASNNDDNSTSQSQLSTSQSNKSGKSGKSSRRKKKTDGTSSAKTKRSKSKSKTKKKSDERPQKSKFHFLFDAVRYLAIVASSMMLLMQIIPMVILGDESTWLQISVRSYLAIFCISFVLTESRIPFLQKIVSPHSNWILRGFLYSFIGLIGMEQDIALKVEEMAASSRGNTSSILGPGYGTLFATLFMSITSWIMIGVGVLYTLLGLFCMQSWYDRMEKAHGEKVREWKDKKKMEETFRKEKEDYREYEKDRREGRGEWYDDLE